MSQESEYFLTNEAAGEILAQSLAPHVEAIHEFISLPDRGIEHVTWLVAHMLLLRKHSELCPDDVDFGIDGDNLREKVRRVWTQKDSKSIFPHKSTEDWYRSVIENCLNFELPK